MSKTSRMVRLVAGIVVGLVGIVWFLQGIGVLPGSFMTGSQFWAVIGAVLIIVGAWLAAGARGARGGS